jgi:16S rRNA (guanine1207-N2)-methyltransferase
MNGALKTLMLAAHARDILNTGQNILFINAHNDPDLRAFKHKITCVQYFYPDAKTLLSNGYEVIDAIDDRVKKNYDAALVLLPQNTRAARHDIACALHLTTKNAPIICAAPNNAGGKRLKSHAKQFNIQNVSYISKNKAKCGIFTGTHAHMPAIHAALEDGKLKFMDDIKAYSQAGIYGWNKIDAGAALLLEQIDHKDLQGMGADFGCGYGFLSMGITNNASPHMTRLTCIDADARAVAACRKNLEKTTVSTSYIWDDLTAPENLPQDLDFILMNPPFHTGKKADTAIGQAFIKNAAKALKTKGILWMVANTHLPYERTVHDIFSTYKIIAQAHGFKVIRAVK